MIVVEFSAYSVVSPDPSTILSFLYKPLDGSTPMSIHSITMLSPLQAFVVLRALFGA